MEPNDSLEKARQRAQSALAGYTKVLDLEKKLAARLQAAARDEIDAAAAQADAEMNAILADSSGQAACAKEAETAAAKLAKAQREQTGIKSLQERIPGMTETADDEIYSARSELEVKLLSVSVKARYDLAARLRTQAVQLGQILQDGFALSAAGILVGPLLTDTKLVNPVRDMFQPFIGGFRMILDDEPVALNTAWRGNPESVALFEAHRPDNELIATLRQHVGRIENQRRRTPRAANSTARPNPPAHAPEPVPAPAADADASPHGKPLQIATAPLDISIDRKEPLTPAEMDTLWLQASGGIPRPAPDAIFTDIAGRIRPWQVQSLIEREARVAAGKVRLDSELNTSSQKFQPPSVVRDVTIPVDTGDDDGGPPLSRAQMDALGRRP